MEKYIITGQDKELERVLREQRIRMNRGLISITPISECGLITEEDARKTLDDKLAEKDEKISELTASIKEKDNSITELTTERDSMKARIAELEASATTDDKNLPAAGDSKDLPAEDTKGVDAIDNKDLPPADEKKVVKKVSK